MTLETFKQMLCDRHFKALSDMKCVRQIFEKCISIITANNYVSQNVMGMLFVCLIAGSSASREIQHVSCCAIDTS